MCVAAALGKDEAIQQQRVENCVLPIVRLKPDGGDPLPAQGEFLGLDIDIAENECLLDRRDFDTERVISSRAPGRVRNTFVARNQFRACKADTLKNVGELKSETNDAADSGLREKKRRRWSHHRGTGIKLIFTINLHLRSSGD